jgi:CheY-like chemotaxis protein
MLKIEEAAKSIGLPIQFAGSGEEFLDSFRKAHPALVIADLTLTGIDLAALFEALRADTRDGAVPLLGYTTHADWKRTNPLHARCTRVVTKETMSRGLGELLQQLGQRG